ncbi:hypothetical protein [Bradyrhizobium sp. LM6.9]
MTASASDGFALALTVNSRIGAAGLATSTTLETRTAVLCLIVDAGVVAQLLQDPVR